MSRFKPELWHFIDFCSVQLSHPIHVLNSLPQCIELPEGASLLQCVEAHQPSVGGLAVV